MMYRSTPIDAQVQPIDIGAAYDDIVCAVGPSVVKDDIDEETRPVEQSFHIGTVDGEGAAWITEVLTNGRPIRYELDTGAPISVEGHCQCV